jgi:hypothetical protein
MAAAQRAGEKFIGSVLLPVVQQAKYHAHQGRKYSPNTTRSAAELCHRTEVLT